jgi:hypothetical protein
MYRSIVPPTWAGGANLGAAATMQNRVNVRPTIPASPFGTEETTDLNPGLSALHPLLVNAFANAVGTGARPQAPQAGGGIVPPTFQQPGQAQRTTATTTAPTGFESNTTPQGLDARAAQSAVRIGNPLGQMADPSPQAQPWINANPSMGTTDAWHKANPSAPSGPSAPGGEPDIGSGGFWNRIGVAQNTLGAPGQLPGNPATPAEIAMLPHQAYGGDGARVAIVGDPQADGLPNPEMVRIVNGKLDVTPLKGATPPMLPRFAYGSDVPPPAPEVDWKPEDENAVDLANKQQDYAQYSHLMNDVAAEHSALYGGNPPPVTRAPATIDPSTGLHYDTSPGQTIIPPTYASPAPSAPPPAPGNAAVDPSGFVSSLEAPADMSAMASGIGSEIGAPSAAAVAPTGSGTPPPAPGNAPAVAMTPFQRNTPPPAPETPDFATAYDQSAPPAVNPDAEKRLADQAKQIAVLNKNAAAPKVPQQIDPDMNPLAKYEIAMKGGLRGGETPEDIAAWNKLPRSEQMGLMRAYRANPTAFADRLAQAQTQLSGARAQRGMEIWKEQNKVQHETDVAAENERFHDMRNDNWQRVNEERQRFHHAELAEKDYVAKDKIKQKAQDFENTEREREAIFDEIQVYHDQAGAKGDVESQRVLNAIAKAPKPSDMEKGLAFWKSQHPAEPHEATIAGRKGVVDAHGRWQPNPEPRALPKGSIPPKNFFTHPGGKSGRP